MTFGIDGIRLMDRGVEVKAIVTIAADGRDAADLARQLRERVVNASVSLRDDGVIDMDDKQCAAVLRLSPHYYDTEAELDAAVSALIDALHTTP